MMLRSDAVPDLIFGVEGAAGQPFAAVPTLVFRLLIQETTGLALRSVTLNTQIRIAAALRSYSREEQARLGELFGDPHRWSDTLKGFLWARNVLIVPPFSERIAVDLSLPCTYDFEVISAKFLHGLKDGEVPLEFLFSGSMFFETSDARLRIAQIPWEKEATFRLPVQVWKDVMEMYFPDAAWLRLRRETFDRLYRYRAERALPTWEAAIDELLRPASSSVRDPFGKGVES